MPLEDRAEEQMTREDLSDFLAKLADSYFYEPAQWDNNSIEDFLRAWSAWLIDMDGYFKKRGEEVPTEPSWQLIAQMLLAARTYE